MSNIFQTVSPSFLTSFDKDDRLESTRDNPYYSTGITAAASPTSPTFSQGPPRNMAVFAASSFPGHPQQHPQQSIHGQYEMPYDYQTYSTFGENNQQHSSYSLPVPLPSSYQGNPTFHFNQHLQAFAQPGPPHDMDGIDENQSPTRPSTTLPSTSPFFPDQALPVLPPMPNCSGPSLHKSDDGSEMSDRPYSADETVKHESPLDVSSFGDVRNDGSSPQKRIYIAPPPFETTSSSEQTSAASTDTYSTHDPPTPGSAPSQVLDFKSQLFSPYSTHPSTAPLPVKAPLAGPHSMSSPVMGFSPQQLATPHTAHPLSHHGPFGPPRNGTPTQLPALPVPAGEFGSQFQMRQHASPLSQQQLPNQQGFDDTFNMTPGPHTLAPIRQQFQRDFIQPQLMVHPKIGAPPLPNVRQGGVRAPPDSNNLALLQNPTEDVKTIEAASGATSFVSKLWFLLSQPEEFGEYIRWTFKGKGFILSHNSPTFGEAILSRFFRHSNIASFIRQLNLYKMQRMSQLALLEDLQQSGNRVDGELTHTGFSHPNLQRGRPEWLHLIKPNSGRKRSRKDLREAAQLDGMAPPPSAPGKKTRTTSYQMHL